MVGSQGRVLTHSVTGSQGSLLTHTVAGQDGGDWHTR